jgi:type I restriction enzyme, S subunit
MNDWKETTWGNITTLEYGKPVNYKQLDGTVPVYGTNGQIGFTNSEPLCKFPSVIVGRKGAYRGVHFSPVPFCVIDTGFFLKPICKDIIDLKFAYYNLLNTDINRLDSGSAIPSTSRPDFYQLDLLLPQPPEQKSIADILSCLDAKIENLRRQNETLEQIAQTLFKHWFIDFEFPNADGKPYKSSGGAMSPSELDDIPEGWHIGKLGDVARVINGRAYKQTEFREEGTPIVRIQNLTGKGNTVYSDLLLDEDKYISAGDVIYAWSATFGSYIWRGTKSIYHYHIWKLDCFSKLFKYYLHIHLKRVSDSVQGQGTGSIFTHITKTLMENQELYIPDKQTMKKWDAIISPIFDKIMTNFNQIQTLTKTRDALLPKLMSGQLCVKE